jgi:hypothetical protein
MKLHIHYEAAFGDYLRSAGIPYVGVDEARRAALRSARLKSFDFVVYGTGGRTWLVDIKGRRWGPRRDGQPCAWENWITQADLDGLSRWEELGGDAAAALLVFAYWLQTPQTPPDELVHTYRQQRYVFAGVPLRDYVQHARVRSPKWGTVSVPRKAFAACVRPVAAWLRLPAGAAVEASMPAGRGDAGLVDLDLVAW